MEADKGLPFLQKLQNVARYESGKVIILDRRVYPNKVEFVECAHYDDVAQAIHDMVTQSYGPWVASAYGMVIAGKIAKTLSEEKAIEELKQAAHVLTHARPTTSKGMVRSINKILDHGLKALAEGKDVEQALLDHVNQTMETRYIDDRKIATYAVSLLPDPATVLTQCYAETLIGFVLLISLEQGKKISLICPETRPYLQGARLTASASHDLGVPTTVITDNMPAYVLSQGKTDAFICAADVVTMDGHVVNKIGTSQIALAAHYYNVPFYVICNPSLSNPTIDTVKIEERNPDETLYAMGQRTAMEGVSGYYPAFDITAPHLVNAVITSKGVFSPYDIKNHFSE